MSTFFPPLNSQPGTVFTRSRVQPQGWGGRTGRSWNGAQRTLHPPFSIHRHASLACALLRPHLSQCVWALAVLVRPLLAGFGDFWPPKLPRTCRARWRNRHRLQLTPSSGSCTSGEWFTAQLLASPSPARFLCWGGFGFRTVYAALFVFLACCYRAAKLFRHSYPRSLIRSNGRCPLSCAHLLCWEIRHGVAQQPLGAECNLGGHRTLLVGCTELYAPGWQRPSAIPRAWRRLSPSCSFVHSALVSHSLPPIAGLRSLITCLLALCVWRHPPTQASTAVAVAEDQNGGFLRSRKELRVAAATSTDCTGCDSEDSVLRRHDGADFAGETWAALAGTKTLAATQARWVWAIPHSRTPTGASRGFLGDGGGAPVACCACLWCGIMESFPERLRRWERQLLCAVFPTVCRAGAFSGPLSAGGDCATTGLCCRGLLFFAVYLLLLLPAVTHHRTWIYSWLQCPLALPRLLVRSEEIQVAALADALLGASHSDVSCGCRVGCHLLPPSAVCRLGDVPPK